MLISMGAFTHTAVAGRRWTQHARGLWWHDATDSYMVGTWVWLYRPATDRDMDKLTSQCPYTFSGEDHNKDGRWMIEIHGA